MLNYFTHLTSFKHFESSTCSYYHIQSHDTCGQHKAGNWIWTCEHVEDPKCLKLVRYFWLYSVLIKDQFWLLLMLSTSLAKARQFFLHRNANCSVPKTVTGVTKVANERYLPYIQPCEFLCSLGVKVDQS